MYICYAKGTAYSDLAEALEKGGAVAGSSGTPPGDGLETGPAGGPPTHGRTPQLHPCMLHLHILNRSAS